MYVHYTLYTSNTKVSILDGHHQGHPALTALCARSVEPQCGLSRMAGITIIHTDKKRADATVTTIVKFSSFSQPLPKNLSTYLT